MSPNTDILPVKNTCVIELTAPRGRLSLCAEDITDSCSGIIIDAARGLVITSASIFHPFLDVKHGKVFKLTQSLDHRWFKHVQVSVTVEADDRSKQDDTLDHQVSSPLADGDLIDRTTEQYGGEILKMSKIPSFAIHLSRLFSSSDGWQITYKNMKDTKRSANSKEIPQDDSLHILSCFVLIKLRNWQERRQNLSMSRHLGIGDPLYAVATPFGVMSAGVFMNSVSKGIVCNVAGSLVVTDARSVPGCEGGALYTGTYPHG